MTHEHDSLDPLAAHFEALKAQAPEPDAALMARIMADADREQAVHVAPLARPSHSGLLAGLVNALGGWPAMAGLATAAVAGVWIGAVPPDGLAAAAQQVLGNDSTALMIDVDFESAFILAEGAS